MRDNSQVRILKLLLQHSTVSEVLDDVAEICEEKAKDALAKKDFDAFHYWDDFGVYIRGAMRLSKFTESKRA